MYYPDEYGIGNDAYEKQYYGDKYDDEFPATTAPSRSYLRETANRKTETWRKRHRQCLCYVGWMNLMISSGVLLVAYIAYSKSFCGPCAGEGDDEDSHNCRQTSNPLSKSCYDVYQFGCREPGVYNISVTGQVKSAYCENRYMYIQRRIGPSVDFFLNWDSYAEGFGRLELNYWIGLDLLHNITSTIPHGLRVDLEDWDGTNRYAEYTNFRINDATSKYQLTVDGYSGDAGDSMLLSNGMFFTTKDRDNDKQPGIDNNCAIVHHGAWWYNHCGDANLNGLYRSEENREGDQDGIYWLTFASSPYISLKQVSMKIIQTKV